MQPGRVNQGASRPCLNRIGSFLSLGGKYRDLVFSLKYFRHRHTLVRVSTLTYHRHFDRRTSIRVGEAARTAWRLPCVRRASSSQTPWNQASGKKDCPSGDGYQMERWLLQCYSKQEENLLDHRISESQKG